MRNESDSYELGKVPVEKNCGNDNKTSGFIKAEGSFN
jgi:hypothetical protein